MKQATLTAHSVLKDCLNSDFSEEELRLANTKSRYWKSVGSDGIPPEVYKTALPDTPFFGYLLRLLGKEWGGGKVDPLWNIAEVAPYRKKETRNLLTTTGESRGFLSALNTSAA
ncbi:MAG: uncharacterized protein A8A55_3075 [Amphiamblys sp. WSBS2006]|nr:MAG: uncharacterized protein A8A55_3075 [Amphiamblys sp. WSBS2006]